MGVILEFKAVQLKSFKGKVTEDKLDKEADKALEQIDAKGYNAELLQQGITDILKVGIAFHRKQFKISDNLDSLQALVSPTFKLV